MKTITLTILLILSVITIEAQVDSSHVNLKTGVTYNSYLHYYGRSDSIQLSGLFPSAEIWLGKSVYFSGTAVLTNDRNNYNYGGTVLTAGYIFQNEEWFNHFYASKPLYTSDAQLLQAAMKAQIGLTVTKLSRVVNLTAGIDSRFGDNMDIGLMSSIDHLIELAVGKNILMINPTVSMNAGTRKFTSSQYKQNNIFLLPEEQLTESVKKMQILSYEAMVPLIYTAGNIQMILTPSYVIPQNIIRNVEMGEKSFYITASLKFTL